MPKEIPILFSTDMVEAILADRKTMTRRIVKPLPDCNTTEIVEQAGFKGKTHASRIVIPGDPIRYEILEMWKCPYGNIGDLLWVREAHYAYGKWVKNGTTKTGKQKWKFIATSKEILYTDKPPSSFRKSRSIDAPDLGFWYKRNSLFMPKYAARLWLHIANIKAERLCVISQEDAKLEGVIPCPHRPSSEGCKPHKDNSLKRDCYYCAFKVLWNKINGNWHENPWVWVVSFKVLSTTGKPNSINQSNGAIATADK